jgi:hypothetical protein
MGMDIFIGECFFLAFSLILVMGLQMEYLLKIASYGAYQPEVKIDGQRVFTVAGKFSGSIC